MSITPFTSPSGGLTNITSFPDIPPDNAAYRLQFQTPSDELADYMNNTLLNGNGTIRADDVAAGSALAAQLSTLGTSTPITGIWSAQDLHMFTTAGRFIGNGTGAAGTNTPTGAYMDSDTTLLVVLSALANGVYHLLFDGTGLYYEQCYSGVWSAWINITTPPSCRVLNSANVSIATDTPVIIPFNSSRFDKSAIHNNTTNNSRLTCKMAGVYIISATLRFSSNATGCREAIILLNGTLAIAHATQQAVQSNPTLITIQTIFSLVVNDYVELQVYQDSGATLTIDALGAYSPEFSMVKIG